MRRESDRAGRRRADLVGRVRGPRVGPPAARRSRAGRDARARARGHRARRDRLAADRRRRAARRCSTPTGCAPSARSSRSSPTTRSGATRRSHTAVQMATLLEAVDAEHFVTALVNDPADWSRPALSDAQWDHMVDVIDEVDAVAADHGLRQVVHPHVATLVETADELERFLDASAVPICLDTGHVTLGGADAVELAERGADRGRARPPQGRPPRRRRPAPRRRPRSDGRRPGRPVRPARRRRRADRRGHHALERNGYDGLYVLEQDVAITGGEPPAGEGPVRDVAKSVAYLRSVEPAAEHYVRRGGRHRPVRHPPPSIRGGPIHEKQIPPCADGDRRPVAGRRWPARATTTTPTPRRLPRRPVVTPRRRRPSRRRPLAAPKAPLAPATTAGGAGTRHPATPSTSCRARTSLPRHHPR